MSAIKGVDYIRVFPSSSVLFKELSFFFTFFPLSLYVDTRNHKSKKKKFTLHRLCSHNETDYQSISDSFRNAAVNNPISTDT